MRNKAIIKCIDEVVTFELGVIFILRLRFNEGYIQYAIFVQVGKHRNMVYKKMFLAEYNTMIKGMYNG